MAEQEKKQKTIYIAGMHCVSCEVLITEELRKVEGVENIHISHKSGVARVVCGCQKANDDELVQAIKKAGYQAAFQPIEKQKKTPATFGQWISALLIIFGLYLVYVYLRWIGLFEWFDVDISGKVSFGVAFLVGIVASLSTCLAIVGAVVISFGAKYQASSNVKPQLMFQTGRLLGFFVLGGVLGTAGKWLEITSGFYAWFTIAIAAVLALLGLNILGWAPSVGSLGLRLPRRTLNVWNRLKNSEHRAAPFLLGAFTFFLPCGFTQSMQLIAIASGSFWQGAFTMLLFALGTAPVLFIVGLTSAQTQKKERVVLQKAVGLVVLIFAWSTLSAGLATVGFSANVGDGATKEKAAVSEGLQTVEMTVGSSGYTPDKIKIKLGVPVRWVINGKQLNGCNGTIIVPKLGIKKKLSQGENIIEFTPTEKGVLSFSCWMGMVRGQFIVE